MLSLPADLLDRTEHIARVRDYLAALGLNRHRGIVFGSVGRGDFTVDSDTDLLIVSEKLPADVRARLHLLYSVRDVAPEVEPIGWRTGDWQRRQREGDPFIDVLLREVVEVAA